MVTQAEIDARMAKMPWLQDPELFMDPEEQWQTYTAEAQPFWQKRAPLYDVGQGLQARYMMAAPRMLESGDSALGTFGEYLRGWGGGYDYPAAMTDAAGRPTVQRGVPIAQGGVVQPYGALSIGDLRSRAREASAAATPGAGGAGGYLGEGFGLGDEEFRRRAWYLRQFGADAANQQRNLMGVANLMATQRPGGGEYGGGMAAAIRSAMGRLKDQYVRGGGERESFLDWYLKATEPVEPGSRELPGA